MWLWWMVQRASAAGRWEWAEIEYVLTTCSLLLPHTLQQDVACSSSSQPSRVITENGVMPRILSKHWTVFKALEAHARYYYSSLALRFSHHVQIRPSSQLVALGDFRIRQFQDMLCAEPRPFLLQAGVNTAREALQLVLREIHFQFGTLALELDSCAVFCDPNLFARMAQFLTPQDLFRLSECGSKCLMAKEFAQLVWLESELCELLFDESQLLASSFYEQSNIELIRTMLSKRLAASEFIHKLYLHYCPVAARANSVWEANVDNAQSFQQQQRRRHERFAVRKTFSTE